MNILRIRTFTTLGVNECLFLTSDNKVEDKLILDQLHTCLTMIPHKIGSQLLHQGLCVLSDCVRRSFAKYGCDRRGIAESEHTDNWRCASEAKIFRFSQRYLFLSLTVEWL